MLRLDLQGIATDLKWSCVELLQIAVRLSQAGNELDAQAVMRMITVFQSDEDKLSQYADEIGAGRDRR